MKFDKKQARLEALAGQLEFLKSRTQDSDAAHWRKMGKLAQDFTVWLERARPWMSCASSLIAIRVEQVIGEVNPLQPSQKCLQKLSDLIEEAGRQLAHPGQPIQVIDLERDEKSPMNPGAETCFGVEGISLPSGLVAIPDLLRPQGHSAVQFLYIIPN